MPTPAQFRLGAATVSILRLGLLEERIADWLRLAEADWPPEHRPLFAHPIIVPIQCVHIALPGRSLLVDACHPELAGEVGTPAPGAEPTPGLLDQLAAAGVDAAGVDTVVITHPHFDHYCGIVADAGGLLFPRARHLLGRADWEAAQDDLKSPASPFTRALGLAMQRGALDLVDGPRDLGDGLSIVPTPGETPGHQALRVESGGEVLYILGDLYHHEVEVERPDWGVHWADPASIARSREQLAAAALREGALLIAAHIDGVGRLARAGAGVRWENVERRT